MWACTCDGFSSRKVAFYMYDIYSINNNTQHYLNNKSCDPISIYPLRNYNITKYGYYGYKLFIKMILKPIIIPVGNVTNIVLISPSPAELLPATLIV